MIHPTQDQFDAEVIPALLERGPMKPELIKAYRDGLTTDALSYGDVADIARDAAEALYAPILDAILMLLPTAEPANPYLRDDLYGDDLDTIHENAVDAGCASGQWWLAQAIRGVLDPEPVTE